MFSKTPEIITNALHEQSNNTLFRWIYWIIKKNGNFPFNDKDIQTFHYLLDTLQLNDDQWTKLLTHRAPKGDRNYFKREIDALMYHVEQLFVLAVKHQKNPIILKLLETKMSEKVFIDGLFVNDMYNKNAIEQSLKDNKLEIVKYLFSKKQVLKKYHNDSNKDLLYRLMCIAYNFANDEVLEFVLNTFKIPNDVLLSFMDYKYSKNSKKEKYLTQEYDEWFVSGNLLFEAVESGKIQRLQQLLALIKNKQDTMKYVAKKGRGGSWCLAVCAMKGFPDSGRVILEYIEDKKERLSLIEQSCKNQEIQKNENALKIIQGWKAL